MGEPAQLRRASVGRSNYISDYSTRDGVNIPADYSMSLDSAANSRTAHEAGRIFRACEVKQFITKGRAEE